ncbi:MAG: M48 family metalloprotease [Desulfuromonadales bacterium]
MPVKCFAALVMVLFSLLSAAGCAVNPVTGQQQLMLLSEQDEFRLGSQTDQAVIDQYGLYLDDGLQNYLQGMGRSMAGISHRPGLAWQFKVMDSPVVNAFAAPGGYVYVTRGLLAAINDEAELAGILGHEIGHVTARHSAQRYSNMMLTNIGLSLGQEFLGGYGDMLGTVLESGAGLLFLKFSRDDEREADALGVEYASRAGYDAQRMADFFITLRTQPSADGEQGARLPEFFSTHPSPANRESNVRAMAASWQSRLPRQNFLVNRRSFLKQIDGLVYGEDPRKGFHEGNWYYLPQYGVKIPIPGQWTFEQEGNNLQLSHPDRKAVCIVGIRPDSQSSQVVAGFLRTTGATIHRDRMMTNNGMSARMLLSSINDGDRRAVIVSHFYQQGPDVFAFHAMTSAAEFASLQEQIQSPANGFTAMTDRARLNPQPQRIVVKSVGRPATLEAFLRAEKVDSELWPEIAWLNGWQLSAVLASGEQVKVIE